MIKLLRTIDFVGPQFLFEDETRNRFKTLEGGLISFIIYGISITIGFLFGQEIYQRKMPNSSYSKELIEESVVGLSQFPIMITATDRAGIPVSFDKTFDSVVETVSIDSNGYTDIENKTLAIKPCNYTKFTAHSKFLEQSRLNDIYSYYCINFNQNTTIKNELISKNSKLLSVYLYPCGTFSERQCGAEISINNMMVILSLITSYVDPLNYTNPVQYFEYRYLQPIIYGTLKLNYVSITNDIFLSDDGWLFQQLNETDFLSINPIRNDANIIPADQPYKPYYVAMFDSPKIRVKTSRNYMKIQELFAKVGGIANAAIIIMTIASKHYLRFKFLLFINESIDSGLDVTNTEQHKLCTNSERPSSTENRSSNRISKQLTQKIKRGERKSYKSKTQSPSLLYIKTRKIKLPFQNLSLASDPRRVKLNYNYLSYLKFMLCGCQRNYRARYREFFIRSHAILDIKTFISFFVKNYFNKGLATP